MASLEVVNVRVAIDSSPAPDGRNTGRDIWAQGLERNASRFIKAVGYLDKWLLLPKGYTQEPTMVETIHPTLHEGASEPIVEKV
ncbi:unnamed protein product [Clonostachys rosea]|uniref:Uncharacterized protein n=1 Tax=Bionectria ochroleuca TaxID=29856 RepID=A0ABY6TUD2_BIOOC|nr:unnamed protein product [Clonostachys rosea]